MEIQEIKSRLDIHTVLGHYGLRPDRNGMLNCPFHADGTASLKIYDKANTFHCFGCGKNGDAIEFCTLQEGNKHKGILKATGLVGETSQVNNKANPEEGHSRKNHTGTLTKFFSYFQNNLDYPAATKPKAYLESRNLKHGLLEIGYNSGQFHHRGKLGEAGTQACVDAGLLIPYKGPVPKAKGATYTAFAKDCIIFPLKDKTGNIASLYGRGITNNDKAKHYYLKDRQGLYPGYPHSNTTKLILTEAIIDAATLLQVPEITKIYSILACYGTNGLGIEHLQAIHGLEKLEEITFFFDGDKAGAEAIKKYHKHRYSRKKRLRKLGVCRSLKFYGIIAKVLIFYILKGFQFFQ